MKSCTPLDTPTLNHDHEINKLYEFLQPIFKKCHVSLEYARSTCFFINAIKKNMLKIHIIKKKKKKILQPKVRVKP